MPISAIVIQPVEFDRQIVLPMNTEVHGTIARVRRVGAGLTQASPKTKSLSPWREAFRGEKDGNESRRLWNRYFGCACC